MEKKIELIPGTRVTIEANSDGSTVTIYEPETPNYQFKDGDFVRSIVNVNRLKYYYLYIYSKINRNNGVVCHKIYSLDREEISPCHILCKIDDLTDSRLMTKDEKNIIISELKKDGEQWDAENKCIVDIQPEFKDGDFIYTEYEDEKCIGILKGDYKGEDQPIELYCALFGITTFADNFRIGCERKRHDRLATGSEMQEIVKFLENKGLFWNPISKKVEKIKWIPKHGDHYYYVLSYGEILETIYDEDCEADKIRILIGNFFKTKEQAEAAAYRVKKLFAEIQADLYK